MNPTAIPYLDFVWNPVVGCTPAGEGCANCYAEREHARRHKAYKAGAKLPDCYSKPFGDVRCLYQRLDAPLRRNKPARIGVNFLSDTFHSGVPDDFIDRMFAVMSLCSKHTFVLLTKRPERMRAYLSTPGRNEKIVTGSARVLQARSSGTVFVKCRQILPMPNVWLGTTVWNQDSADNNIPPLLATPAALRWVSYEPALGPVDFECFPSTGCPTGWLDDVPGIDWVVCGGESGPGARPMHPDWARSVRDQCKAAGVPFWFKQWGEWAPNCLCGKAKPCKGTPRPATGPKGCMFRCGTKAAGNRLYGEVIEQLPEASRA